MKLRRGWIREHTYIIGSLLFVLLNTVAYGDKTVIDGDLEVTGTAVIGDSTPDARLHVKSSGVGITNGILLEANSTENDLGFLYESSTDAGALKLRSVTTDKVLITASGDSYFNGGDVGIGTSNPERNFEITGNGNVVACQLENTGTGGLVYSAFSTNNGSGMGGGKYIIFDDTAGVSRLAIDNAGKVGIGTTSPGATLDVLGNTNGTAAYFERNNGFNNSEIRLNAPTTGSDWGLTAGAGIGGFSIIEVGVANHLVIEEGGNVGIGTTAPERNFEITGDGNVVACQLENTGTGGLVYSAFSTNNGSGMGGGKFVIFDDTAGVSRLAIDNAGKVGIGTTSPDEALDVNGGIRLRVHASPPGATGYPMIFAKNDGTYDKLWARDEEWNQTLLSSHQDPREVNLAADTSFGDTAVELPFCFSHSNSVLGKGAVVDMAAVVDDLEAITGKTYTHVYDLPPEEVVDYLAWQSANQARREREAKEKLLAEMPEVEVTDVADAIELVEIMEEVETVQQVTRFRLIPVEGRVESYVTDEVVTEVVGTGWIEGRLRSDCRLDELTGKIYRRRTLDEIEIPPVPAPEMPQWIQERMP